jgi:hypothetical protein
MSGKAKVAERVLLTFSTSFDVLKQGGHPPPLGKQLEQRD